MKKFEEEDWKKEKEENWKKIFIKLTS